MIKLIRRSGAVLVAIVLLFSCDKEWEPFAHYYPRKQYPGRGDATIQGDDLRGRFGYSRGNDGLLYINCILPMLTRTSEWTLFFSKVPAAVGTYGLIPEFGFNSNTCNREPLKNQVSATVASAAGDISLESYNPYCKDPKIVSQLKINKFSNGNLEGEFSMHGVNLFDSTDFITIEKGQFSSPEVRK